MKIENKAHAFEMFLAAKPRLDIILADAATDVVSERTEFTNAQDFLAAILETAAKRVREHNPKEG